MISDVLSDAYDQIREYLDSPEFDDTYSGSLREEIERLVREMDRIRALLDRPPVPDSPTPEGG
jgi:hypothetical protein